MLASASTVEVVAEAIKRYNVPVSVIDPVRLSLCVANLFSRLAGHGVHVRGAITPRRCRGNTHLPTPPTGHRGHAECSRGPDDPESSGQ